MYLHVQETGRSLLLMVDEKKILPINAINIGAAASSDVQPLQCYSVQIPVVAYHNVPLQISNISRQMQENVKIECQSDRTKDREFVENIDPASMLTNSVYDSKESEKYSLNGNELFAIICIVYLLTFSSSYDDPIRCSKKYLRNMYLHLNFSNLEISK